MKTGGGQTPGRDKRELRKFTLRFIPFAVIFGGIFWRREWWHGHWTPYLIWLGAWGTFILAALVFPALARPVRALLVRLAALIGKTLTWAAMAIIYFLVLTPLGLLARLFRKKFLELGREPGKSTFWTSRTPAASEKEGWERQF